MLQSVQTHAHTCVRLCVLSVSVSARCAVVLLVARLQDCVEAVCNKCAQASGPKKIYHKQEGRQSAQGKEEDGASGGEGSGVGKEMQKRRKEMGEKGEDRLVGEKRKGGRGCFLLGPAMFPIM